jgi:hypothetical protein
MINLVLIGLLPGPADLPRGTYKPIFAILEPEHFFFPKNQNYNFPPKNPEKFKPKFFTQKFTHSKSLKKNSNATEHFRGDLLDAEGPMHRN